MTNGLATAKPVSQQNVASAAAPVGGDLVRQDSSHSSQGQKQAELSPARPGRADSLTEAFEASTLISSQPDLSPSFEQQVWSAPVQTAGTVAPEMLMANELQHAPTDYTSYSFNPQPLQQVPAFQQAHFPNPSYSAMSHTTASLLDSDPTLSRDLFDSQPLLGAMQTVYGNNAFFFGLQHQGQQHVGLQSSQHDAAHVEQQLIDFQASTQGSSDWPMSSHQVPTPEPNDRSFQACSTSSKRKRGSQGGLSQSPTEKRAKNSD